MTFEERMQTQEFVIRDLSTSSVTFFPARASVVRDIKDVALKPGANQVTIYGLTPTADENSIKVDGKGSATITDMMVELVPNRDRYEDVYPSDSEDDEESSESDSGGESDNIKALRKEEEKITQAIKKAQESMSSASGRLYMLENYARSIETDRPREIASCLLAFEEERKKGFDIFHKNEVVIASLTTQKEDVVKKRKKTLDKALRAKAKANKHKQKEEDRKTREKEKKLQAKRQLKVDRIQFWPKKVYKVTVSLDSISETTPASSRRGSVSSVIKPGSVSGDCHINLSISYITSSASWAPRYDLSLHTPTNSGSIVYRAEYSNTTSEVWKDAKVVLSTSQTAFQGLGEVIPHMQPWHIDIAKSAFRNKASPGPLQSNQELHHRPFILFGEAQRTAPARESLFGLDTLDIQTQSMLQQQQMQSLATMQRHQNPFVNPKSNQKPMPPPPGPPLYRGLFASNASQHAQQAPAPGGACSGSTNASNFGGFGASNVNTANCFGSASASRSRGAATPPPPPSPDEEPADFDRDYGDDADTMIADLPALDTLESSWSESGLTANYDVPGLRTVNPSFTLRRHKIASITLKDVHLSHLLVPKMRTAAFLKARIWNSSSIALLRGPVGVTLDGSFLGNTTLPRCSAGESFSLSLGVDPSVSVGYGKPTVRKSQSGILNKENSSIYTRTCTVTNTKPNLVIQGLLLDQVPVSNDERLRVDMLQPRGLRREGDVVRSGTGITIAGKEDPKWGKATASFKKAGEVCFDFKIEGGKGARFVVEYETKHPSMEQVYSV